MLSMCGYLIYSPGGSNPIITDTTCDSKTQTLYTDYLPRTVQGETFQKKTDYTLAFSHTHPDIEPYYEKVSFGGRTAALSQMNDSYTRMLAMMVGVEVKAAYGDETEARVQLAVWTSAGLTSIRCLTKEAVGDVNAMNHIPLFGWTVVGQQWDMYIGLVNNGDTGDAVSVVLLLFLKLY